MAIPNLLSLNFLLPFVAHKLDYTKAIRGLRGMPRRILLIGHKATAGSATNNQILKAISNESDALAYFGEGSMLLAMWRAAASNAELGSVIDALPLATAAGAVAADAEVTINTVATDAGEVMLHIAGKRVAVGVSPADTTAAIAVRLSAAINAIASLPVTSAVALNVITLTCNWAGATGNQIDLRSTFFQDDFIAPGVTMTIDSFAARANGATQPDITPYIVAANGYRATEIVLPFNDTANILIIEQEQEARWDCTNMQDGQVITVVKGDLLATHLAWLQSRNSAQVHSLHVRNDRSTPWETAAMAAAQIESSAAIDAAVPYTGIKLIGYQGPAAADNWNYQTDANNIALAGGSVIEPNEDGTGNLLRIFNHYKRAPSGAPDYSKRDLCWIKLGSYWRWFHVNEFQTKYRNGWKIAEYVTEPIPGQKIMTKELVEEIMLGMYMLFMDAGLFQNLEHYQSSLLVEIDGANGKVKVIDEPVMVTQHYQTEITSNLIAGRV